MWDKSPLFESMLDSSHDQVDFLFLINEEVFMQCFIWLPSSIHTIMFLTTINDPTISLDSFYPQNKKAGGNQLREHLVSRRKKSISWGTEHCFTNRGHFLPCNFCNYDSNDDGQAVMLFIQKPIANCNSAITLNFSSFMENHNLLLD